MNREAGEADEAVDSKAEHDVGRLLTFSDGVFAIAITLLVLDLTVPALKEGQTLLGALGTLWPKLLAFGLSFILVGIFWNVHRRVFRLARRIDQRVVIMNMALLAGVCLVPFTSSLLSSYGGTLTGMEIYAADMLAISIVFGTLRYYGERVEVFAPRGKRKARLWECYGMAPVFAAGMLIAPLNVNLGYVAWAVMPWVIRIVRQVYGAVRASRARSSGSQ